MTQEEYGLEYQRGFAKTVRILRYRGASPDRAEDAAQAAWMQGWWKLEQLRDKSALVGWITVIAINHHRRNGRTDARCEALPEYELPGGVCMDSAAMDVAKILRLCHPKDRMLFERQLQGMTTKEIAHEQGLSMTATRLRLFRARRKVRETLEDKSLQSQRMLRATRTAA